MKVLILGGSGMLGHKLWQTLAPRFDTYATFRRLPATAARLGIIDESRTLVGVSVEDFDTIASSIATIHPQVVINCVGIVKQDAAAREAIPSISVNALFPHRLATLCRASGARLIHLSTDCVFSGQKGHYSEVDSPDPKDLYGLTKLLGEVAYDNCLTIRTSMVGRELSGTHGLVEWFLAQKRKRVRGFKRAIFSGFTTAELSNIVAGIVSNHAELSGVWHVAAEPINKFDLLSLVNRIYNLEIEIEPDETFACDRSLNGSRFQAATGYVPPPWPEMIERIRADETPYEEIRRINA